MPFAIAHAFLTVVTKSLYALVRRVTLWNYRDYASRYWPGLSGLDLYVTTLVLFALRFHPFFLARAWGNAHHLRRWRSHRAVSGSPLRVMHVTSPFTALLRGEPGRNLPAEKCEAESVYSDFPKV